MFYKGIILDLDNTIYNYDVCHDYALETIFLYLQKKCSKTTLIKEKYEKISKSLKKELTNTASSHNKAIYFKQLLEQLNLGFQLFSNIHDMYWKSFYEKIECHPGVKDFILWNKSQQIQIGILTDYETEFQIIKLEKLGLLEYIDCVITSEEIGKEKPSTQMFHAIIKKMNLSTNDVIMIGDNFEKDIIGAADLKIFGYWFLPNKNITKSEKYTSFDSFDNLLKDFIEIHAELTKLKQISKFCGERFDLVQSGGGNTSVKITHNWLAIKASGCNLTNVDTKNGYVIMDNSKIIKDIDNGDVKDVIQYNAIGNKRGSIETFMHSVLKKYTVHLHPIQVNRILISKNANQLINQIYPSALIIDYLTPGIKVCNKIRQIYNGENVIFLLNHGIIITSDDIEEVYFLIDQVLTNFEKIQDINAERYKFTNIISKTINSVFDIDNVSYLSEDIIINKYLSENHCMFLQSVTFPDALIYCGVKCLFGLKNVEEYKELYGDSPKIIIENKSLYINANSLSKCKEIEDVLKSQLIIIDSDFDKNYLSTDEICFLNNWDSEKYRKNI